MARARRKRRRLPTVVDRGIGLLEVMLPNSAEEAAVVFLPPGQRDVGGFWFPAGYTAPGDIFTPAQRRLQAKQRQVQRNRHRHRGYPVPPPVVSGSEGTGAAATAVARPHAPPATPLSFDRALPLPTPSSEAAVPCHVPSRSLSNTLSQLRAASIAGPKPARAVAGGRVVDSPKTSD